MAFSEELVEGETVRTYVVKEQKTVSFAGEGVSLGAIKVPEGEALAEIVPEREGYIFAGWYKAPECGEGQEWSVDSDLVTEDMTLFAKWEIKVYDVTFDYGTKGTAARQNTVSMPS